MIHGLFLFNHSGYFYSASSGSVIRAWPGRHFQPGSKSEYLNVLFAGSGYEPSIICLLVKKLVVACVSGLLGANISIGSRQPCI